MGGGISEFEQEFRERYSFIQQIEDSFFGLVKVYRKNTFRYDYIMVLEIGVSSIRRQQLDECEQRLQMIRSHLNQSTLRVYFYKVVHASKTECRQNHLLVYAQYLNRNLKQYLAALRTNPNFALSVQQLIYVLKNVCKGCIAMKKMGIHTIDLSINKIFVSTDGEVLVCPLLYVLESLKAYYSEEDVPNLKNNYKKYSVSRIRNPTQSFPLRNQFMGLFLELSGNISAKKLPEINYLHKIIMESPSLEVFYQSLPQLVQNLQIEQMYREENAPGELYKIS